MYAQMCAALAAFAQKRAPNTEPRAHHVYVQLKKKIHAFRHTHLLDIKPLDISSCKEHPRQRRQPTSALLLRLWKRCNAMIANNLFKPGSKHKLCNTHFKKEHRHHLLGKLDWPTRFLGTTSNAGHWPGRGRKRTSEKGRARRGRSGAGF